MRGRGRGRWGGGEGERERKRERERERERECVCVCVCVCVCPGVARIQENSSWETENGQRRRYLVATLREYWNLEKRKMYMATDHHGRLLATLPVSHRSALGHMHVSNQWEEDEECHDWLRPTKIQSLRWAPWCGVSKEEREPITPCVTEHTFSSSALQGPGCKSQRLHWG